MVRTSSASISTSTLASSSRPCRRARRISDSQVPSAMTEQQDVSRASPACASPTSLYWSALSAPPYQRDVVCARQSLASIFNRVASLREDARSSRSFVEGRRRGPHRRHPVSDHETRDRAVRGSGVSGSARANCCRRRGSLRLTGAPRPKTPSARISLHCEDAIEYHVEREALGFGLLLHNICDALEAGGDSHDFLLGDPPEIVQPVHLVDRPVLDQFVNGPVVG